MLFFQGSLASKSDHEESGSSQKSGRGSQGAESGGATGSNGDSSLQGPKIIEEDAEPGAQDEDDEDDDAIDEKMGAKKGLESYVTDDGQMDLNQLVVIIFCP